MFEMVQKDIKRLFLKLGELEACTVDDLKYISAAPLRTFTRMTSVFGTHCLRLPSRTFHSASSMGWMLVALMGKYIL